MLSIRLFSSFNKISQHGIKNRIFKCRINQFALENKAKFSKIVDFNTQLKSDVVLFTGKRPKFFACIPLFAAVQLIYWSGLSYVIISDFGGYEMKTPNRFWQWLFSKEKQNYVYFASIFSAIGIIICSATFLFTFRLVESLTLNKGGLKVTLTTHKILGFNSKVEAPLRKVSTVSDRYNSKAYISVKIQNKPFYFLLDINGEFKNPLLFDQTIGKKRDFY